MVNALEADALAQALNVDASELPVDHVLITRGGDGASFFSNGEEVTQPAFKVTPVDTTGAGDTFLGSFLALFSNGAPAGEALAYAAAASALQVTGSGAANAIPARTEVEAFLKEQIA